MIQPPCPLEPLDLEPVTRPPPAWVNELLTDADREVRRAAADRRLPIEFVQSNYDGAWRILAALHDSPFARGRRFIEWGCGTGVVTCLAARFGYDARGIEVEPDLVTLAQRLGAVHAPRAQFLCASFKPTDAYVGEFDGIDHRTRAFVASADVVYAYPWPAEENVVSEIFRHLCEPGTLLLTYHGRADFRLRRLRYR